MNSWGAFCERQSTHPAVHRHDSRELCPVVRSSSKLPDLKICEKEACRNCSICEKCLLWIAPDPFAVCKDSRGIGSRRNRASNTRTKLPQVPSLTVRVAYQQNNISSAAATPFVRLKFRPALLVGEPKIHAWPMRPGRETRPGSIWSGPFVVRVHTSPLRPMVGRPLSNESRDFFLAVSLWTYCEGFAVDELAVRCLSNSFISRSASAVFPCLR